MQRLVLMEAEDLRTHYPEFSRRLFDRRRDILNRSDVDRRHFDEQVMSAPGDVGDVSVIDTSADYFLHLEDGYRRELLEIQDAFDRMSRGSYGLCVQCGNPIELGRLRSLPYARLCIDDQSAIEARSNVARLNPKPKL